jgi:putative FmdB family regulatory protein
MPIYEFKCLECGEVSEFLVPGLSAVNNLVCSVCGSHNLEKLMSAPSLIKNNTAVPGPTCCGREERCESPPCSTGERCQRH